MHVRSIGGGKTRGLTTPTSMTDPAPSAMREPRVSALERPVSSGTPQSPAAGDAVNLRLRTAMELHDGVLQMLTAVGLQLAAVRRLVRSDPAAAERMLDRISDSVVAEQREIRLYVDEVRDGTGRADAGGRLAERLETQLTQVGHSWDLATEVAVEGAEGLPPELERQVLRICQEATVNASRHGKAGMVVISVKREEGELVLRVVDDGSGFSFLGDYDHETLLRERLGPVALKHRISAVGGRLSIRSTPAGAALEARLPLNDGSGE